MYRVAYMHTIHYMYVQLPAEWYTAPLQYTPVTLHRSVYRNAAIGTGFPTERTTNTSYTPQRGKEEERGEGLTS